MTEQAIFSEPTWAIVELMGHNVIAGQISEVAVAGSAMLRVDVPAIEGVDAYTKFYSVAAIYAITPTDEASARHAAEHFQQAPITRWVIPYRQLPYGPEEDRTVSELGEEERQEFYDELDEEERQEFYDDLDF